jgi:peptidoglycan-associated lipoprotein
MFVFLRPYSNLLLTLLLVGALGACATTETGSEAGSQGSTQGADGADEASAVGTDSSRSADEATVSSRPNEPAVEQFEIEGESVGTSGEASGTADAQQAAGSEAADAVAGQAGSSAQQADMSTGQADADATGPDVAASDFDSDIGAASALTEDSIAADQEPMQFPIQRYDIEEPLEVQSSADDEIERLRSELAQTETELGRLRAEEEQLEFDITRADSLALESEQTDAGLPSTSPESYQIAEAPASRPAVPDLPGKPAQSTVYFGYDQAAIAPEFESVLVAHAEFLKANPQLSVEIQGNCDERGSREYNIALGQRRALTVKRALELLGIASNRITTVSFGSEKPVAFGRDEESYRLNRRADIVY